MKAEAKKPYEKAWMNRVEIAREWVAYKDDETYPSLIEAVPGYVREARRGVDWDSFDDRHQWPIIDTDKYQHFYRDVFYRKQHNNYVSMDQHEGAVGPIIWSIESRKGSSTVDRNRDLKVLVQSKKGVERVTIPRQVIDECGGVIPAFKQTLPAYTKLRFTKLATQLIKDRLLKYEDQIVRTVYKFGVLYCKEGQTEEDDMYNNVRGSPAFERFLDFLGDRVQLEGFTGYRGGLDVKNNTTGTHSVHTTHIDDCEIMFHVSTLLQYFPADPQQVERKRHLGNDVVLIVFRERGQNAPFNPRVIRSQFNHIFVVFEEDPRSTPKAPCYRIEIGCKEGVLPFGPDLPNPPLLTTSDKCRRWLLSKLVNSERAAYYAPDFLMKFRNTRKAQLQAIIEESLLAAPKKSLSLGRKTGSNILKGASKMMTVRRSKDGMGADSFAISGPRDFKHEGHLDNSGGEGSSFGALLSDKSFLELMSNDETAGIRPADGGKKLTKATSFDDKMASQLVPRSAQPAPLSSSPENGGFVKASGSRRGHAPPAKPLPTAFPTTPLPPEPRRSSSNPQRREEIRSAQYGMSPLSLDKPRSEEESRLEDEQSAPGWVVGTFHTPSEETEASNAAAPPKPGGAGAVPHKPKRVTDVAFERPNKPPPPPPGGTDAKPARRRAKGAGEIEKRRPPPSPVDDGVRFAQAGASAKQPEPSVAEVRKRSGSSSSGSGREDDVTKQTSWEVPEEKRKARPPSSPRGERGEDRIGRRRTMGASANGSPRARASVQGAFDLPSPKTAKKTTSSPRTNAD